MKLLRHILIFLMIAACSGIFLSCQKVIDVDLNSSSPHIVIEGYISDQPGPYWVRISQTVNYNQPNTFPPVSGATVTLSDNIGSFNGIYFGILYVFPDARSAGQDIYAYGTVEWRHLCRFFDDALSCGDRLFIAEQFLLRDG